LCCNGSRGRSCAGLSIRKSRYGISPLSQVHGADSDERCSSSSSFQDQQPGATSELRIAFCLGFAKGMKEMDRNADQQTEVYNPGNLMPGLNALEEYYKTLADSELLNRGGESGYTYEAEQVLRKELARRNLAPSDVKRYAAEFERNKLRDEVIERGGGYRSLGLQFFGRSYLNESDRNASIQVRTKWFTISGIPLIPVASYRFRCTGGLGKRSQSHTRQEVIDRVPLNWSQVFMTSIKTAIPIIGIGLLIVGLSWFLDRGRH
jgi:hypothetical protein